MGLDAYRSKRDFTASGEPRGKKAAARNAYSFVVQQHHASRMHYDFRLELDGVLLSWAVPKGPSLDPEVKRLAVQTEDHPLEYGSFEGVIPAGHYGAGTVCVWDRGHWSPEGDPRKAYAKGHLKFALDGEKLHGGFHLVRTKGSERDESAWLLFKSRDDAAESGSAAEAASSARKPAKKAELPDLSKRKGLRKAPLPESVKPQLATSRPAAPEGDAWLHEIKLDGYRIQARRDAKGGVRLFTRSDNDWTDRMPTLARALAELPLPAVIFDGELVVMHEGLSDFQRLQNSLSSGRESRCLYVVFDMLYLDHYDLRALPQLERKRLLQATLASVGVLDPKPTGPLRYSEHVVGRGQDFFRTACALGAEGSIAKRANAPYVSGRTRAWLKLKGHEREEFVIGGYTEPEGSRVHLGAVLLGQYDAEGKLRYAGKVGTGFSQRSLRDLHAQVTKLARKTPAFDDPPTGAEARGVHWLVPKLVAQIEYAQRTHDGRVRHASFRGIRQDKPASQVRQDREDEPMEAATEGKAKTAKKTARRKTTAAGGAPTNGASKLAIAEAKLTHPERVLYPEQGTTKAQLALYYAQVAQWMLPHVVRRPLMLMRCPDGQGRDCFYQKHPWRGMSDAIRRVSTGEKSDKLDAIYIEDAEGLMGLVQFGALEIHSWGSRIDRLEAPDQLVFDLDPDEGLAWARVIEAAHTVRSALEALDLQSFLKTTGGKGLHVVVPIEARANWDEARAFSKALAEQITRAQPTLYLSTMSKAKRKGKVFIDYLRNGRGSTAVCPYSTRAHGSAPVSMPIAWDELGEALRADHFNLDNAPEALGRRKLDPWQGFFTTGQSLTLAMRKAVGSAEGSAPRRAEKRGAASSHA